MVTRAEAFTGGLRGLLSVGGWAHVMRWAKGRRASVSVMLDYATGEAAWSLMLTAEGQTVYSCTGATLEECVLQAIAGLGR